MNQKILNFVKTWDCNGISDDILKHHLDPHWNRELAALISSLPYAVEIFNSEIKPPISHEKIPHCCGCWIIRHDERGLNAICNECDKIVDLITLLDESIVPEPIGFFRKINGEFTTKKENTLSLSEQWVKVYTEPQPSRVAELERQSERTKVIEAFRKTLKEHWMTSMQCNYEDNTDQSFCFCCAWSGGEPQPNIGMAVDTWINHVIEEFESNLKSSAPTEGEKIGRPR